MDDQKGFIIVLVQLVIHLLLSLTTGTYAQNSAFRENLKTLLSSARSNVSTYGFYNASLGQNSNRVNAIGMCRGDVEIETCRSCISNSTKKILELFPNQTEAILWYDNCMLRYSNNTIAGTVTLDPTFYTSTVENVTSSNEFNQELTTLLGTLRDRAASAGSLRKFATDNRTGPDSQRIFALVQCSPDLSAAGCATCLNRSVEYIPTCFNGKKAGRVVGPSCNFRYENYSFFNQPTTSEIDRPGQRQDQGPGQDKNHRKNQIMIILITSLSGGLVLIVGICLILRKQKRELIDELDTIEDNDVKALQYDFNTIRAATNHFSDANKLGQGGFGSVYKGRLPNGQEIAVKRLSMDSGQGDIEFKNEVSLVAKLQHRNLVRLLGFCLEGAERLLIYEFMPKASLDQLMFDPVKRADLDWDRRYKIIGGIAKGLLYLHEDSRLRIIHRDLKASNVLLDEELNPKISDFGMAKLFVPNENQGNTNRIVGTYGYMAPEYAGYGQYSPKSDVYSFGVLVLEIVSGRKNNSFGNWMHAENLPSYAWKNWRDGTATNVIDSLLGANSQSMHDILRCIHIGLLCVQEHVSNRPTMSKVLLMLISSSLTLPEPSEPAFLMNNGVDSDISRPSEENDSRSKSVSASVNEASITELYPR